MFAKLIELPEGQMLLTKEDAPEGEEHEGMAAGLTLRAPNLPNGKHVRFHFGYRTVEDRDDVFDRFDEESAADAYRGMVRPMLINLGFLPKEH